jgi:hypothetical protein
MEDKMLRLPGQSAQLYRAREHGEID